MLHSTKIRLHTNAKGRAVYATKNIRTGETIEICPVIVVGSNPEASVKKAPYNEWAYQFDGKAVIALGYGSLYNHAVWPNATWRLVKKRHRGAMQRFIEIYALQLIRKSQEICIHYCGAPGDATNPGFEVLR